MKIENHVNEKEPEDDFVVGTSGSTNYRQGYLASEGCW